MALMNSILPDAIDPAKNVRNFIEKMPIVSLAIPTKHIRPMPMFKPPYNPAISE